CIRDRCLRDASPLVCAVIGFPLGAGLGVAKAFEARAAIEAGAGEIDMVLNLSLIHIGVLRVVGVKKKWGGGGGGGGGG
ncbi:hypothetical protein QN385_25795, partial [Pseudomonas sp. CCI2.4]|nr:hypothetical protein [Pseudomonas sp. CCI2.4]